MDGVSVGNFSHQFAEAISGMMVASPQEQIARSEMLADLKIAQHFWMPDNGNLLPRDKAGMRDILREEARPPFDCSVLEWRAYEGLEKAPPGLQSSRRLVIAKREDWHGGEAVTLRVGAYIDVARQWVPYPWRCIMPLADQFVERAGTVRISQDLICTFDALLPTIVEWAASQVSGNRLFMEAFNSFVDELNAYLDLCQALQCTNVGMTDVLAPAPLNAKRCKRGNPPLFDYKILTLPGGIGRGHGGSGAAASQRRSHLRRGHIRRLQDGRKIWVNACFVTGSVPGFIAKDYVIERSARRA